MARGGQRLRAWGVTWDCDTPLYDNTCMQTSGVHTTGECTPTSFMCSFYAKQPTVVGANGVAHRSDVRGRNCLAVVHEPRGMLAGIPASRPYRHFGSHHRDTHGTTSQTSSGDEKLAMRIYSDSLVRPVSVARATAVLRKTSFRNVGGWVCQQN